MHCKKTDFQLNEGSTYLNCAYQSPLSNRVVQAGMKGLLMKTNPQNIGVEDFFQTLELLKLNFSKLIGLADDQRIAYHPSASYGFAIVAQNLPVKKGGKIIMPTSQFPSNYYAFDHFARKNNINIELIKPPGDFSARGLKWNESILNAIDNHTLCVTLDHTHWQDGTIFDLQAIRDKCLDTNTLLIVDGTQSVGALPIEIESLQPDAMICAGYKFLLGPYGSAVSYFGDYFDQGTPIEFNWINRMNSDNFAKLSHYQQDYRPKAFRYNVGEFSSYIHLAMLNESILQLIEWKPEEIQTYCRQITNEFLDIVQEKGYSFDREGQARHIFGIYKSDIQTDSLNKKLEENDISVSVRGDAIRISPHIYNNEEDLMRLATIL